MTHRTQTSAHWWLMHFGFAVLVLSSAAPAAAAQATTAPATPPVAAVRPVTDDYFSTKVVDKYRYFENLKDPEVQQWMKAQARYTRATLDGLPGHAALLKRLTDIVTHQSEFEGETLVSGRYYALRTPAGAQTAKLYMRDGINGRDRLLIDPETLADSAGGHLSIVGFAPSPDGRFVAYGVAPGGSEQPTLHILDAAARKRHCPRRCAAAEFPGTPVEHGRLGTVDGWQLALQGARAGRHSSCCCESMNG